MNDSTPQKHDEATSAASGLNAGLERCPHCGSDDIDGPYFAEYIGDLRSPRWWLECKRCPAGMEAKGETPKELIAAWNLRSNAK